MDKLNRREFLRVSSIVGAATVVAACGSPATPAPAEPTTAPAVAPTTAPAEPVAPPVVDPGTISRYGEAPMLADLVASGSLPPVEERLPTIPYVAPVYESIGKYGGTVRRGFSGVSDRWGPTKCQEVGLTWYNYDLSLHAQVAESWEINDDASTWTFHMRPGMKWSDGHPYTSADIRWQYDYVFLNTDLTPVPPAHYSTGNPRVLCELDTPDDYTFALRYADPKPLYSYSQVREYPGIPAHVMAQYHIETTDDRPGLDAALQTSGFNSWNEYFVDRNNWFMNPDRPSIGPWYPTNALSAELFQMVRNPYFFKVDPEGNQLPYFDRMNHRLFENNDVFNMWILNGEIDFQARHVGMANYTLFKQAEASGGYRVFLGIGGGHTAMQLNHTTKEPKLREFFQNRDVRVAISHAVDRDAINDLIVDGLATPRQYSPISASPNYYPKLSNAYLEYDPDLANQMLDEAGYSARDRDGFRTHADGSAIFFSIEGTAQAGTPDEDAAQMVVRYLADVGLRAAYKYSERSLYTQHFEANEIEAAWWGGDRSVLPIPTPWIFTGTMLDRPWCPAWGIWYGNPNDPNAEEPPEGHWIWDIWAAWEEMWLEPDDETRNRIFERILDIWAEELPYPGFLGETPAPIIVKNGIHNYREGLPMDDPLKDEHHLQTETYFYEDPENHV